MLAILVPILGNVTQAQVEKQEQSTIQPYYGEHQLAGQIKIYIHFDKDPDYYGDALLITNNHEEKLDFDKLAQKYISPILTTLSYYGNPPDEHEVCLQNLDSEKKNCVDVHSDDKKVDINMPD